jgi:hypothetical protein
VTNRAARPTAFLAAVVFLIGVIAAGVMQSDGTTTAAAHAATLVADVGHTIGAKTARFSITVTPGDPAARPSSASGIEDFAHHALVLMVGNVEERLVAGTRYIHVPGQKWVGGPPRAGTSSAIDSLNALRSAVAVHVVGQPRLDGVDTTEYAATIDLASVATAGSTVPPALRSLLAGLAAIPVHVWIDGSHHIRRYMIVIVFGTVKETVDLRYSNFGVKATITAPPADQLAPAGTPLPATGSDLSI